MLGKEFNFFLNNKWKTCTLIINNDSMKKIMQNESSKIK